MLHVRKDSEGNTVILTDDELSRKHRMDLENARGASLLFATGVAVIVVLVHLCVEWDIGADRSVALIFIGTPVFTLLGAFLAAALSRRIKHFLVFWEVACAIIPVYIIYTIIFT